MSSDSLKATRTRKPFAKLKHSIGSLKYLDKGVILIVDVLVSVGATILSFIVLSSIFKYQVISREVFILLAASFVASTISLLVFRIHKIIIRHAEMGSLTKIILAILFKELLLLCFFFFINKASLHWLWMALCLDLLLSTFLMISIRSIVITVFYSIVNEQSGKAKPVIICGTVDSAPYLLNIIESNYKDRYNPIGFISSRKKREGLRIAGLPIYYLDGSTEGYDRFFKEHNYPTLIFPSYTKIKEFSSTLIEYCISNSLPMMVSPNLELVDSVNSMMPRIREIEIEDLLDRAPITVDLEMIGDELSGKAIMVTGAAGSIGSEIVRQLACFPEVKLILVDNAETPTHNLTLELKENSPEAQVVVELVDIRNTARMKNIFEKHKPQIIYHAAAYKHVPLMEENPCEAVTVNVMGTRRLADMAVEYGVRKFVMVSTDKAVNPTNVMGASKRIAEMYVQSLDRAIFNENVAGQTRFITTRFGNVLGSNGSVIPYFKEQIKKGGPVKVTHPDIIRYFMTIPEACRLVLHASVMGDGGEIFVFDMGEQIRIVDLARRMISLAGLIPDKDIKIVYTGLRPGEKLYEELLSNKENTKETSHEKIRVAEVRKVDYEEANKTIDLLVRTALHDKSDDSVREMKAIVPEFKSQNSVYEKFDQIQ